jgi:hypothetical protein
MPIHARPAGSNCLADISSRRCLSHPPEGMLVCAGQPCASILARSLTSDPARVSTKASRPDHGPNRTRKSR